MWGEPHSAGACHQPLEPAPQIFHLTNTAFARPQVIPAPSRNCGKTYRILSSCVWQTSKREKRLLNRCNHERQRKLLAVGLINRHAHKAAGKGPECPYRTI